MRGESLVGSAAKGLILVSLMAAEKHHADLGVDFYLLRDAVHIEVRKRLFSMGEPGHDSRLPTRSGCRWARQRGRALTCSLPSTRPRVQIHASLSRSLAREGLRVERRATIHAVTNLVPSTVLDNIPAGCVMRRLFTILSAIEERVAPRRLGCDLVYAGRKVRA